MRAVIDTSTLVTGVRSGSGAAMEVIRAALTGKVTLLLSYPLLCEYRDVALRREHLSVSELSPGQVESLIAALESVATPVEIEHGFRPLSPDPDDDLVLELAINGTADVIVTGNVRHLRKPAMRFGIAVMDARSFIMMLREAGLI